MIMADTTVLIDIGRGKTHIKDYIFKNQTQKFAISAITITELFTGIYYSFHKQGEKRYLEEKTKYEALLRDFEIVPISNLILQHAGLLIGKVKFEQKTVASVDAIIGATAAILKADKIVTRNPSHFQGFELPVETYEI
jgi:predicted nucleic acid-binding protein